MKASFLVLLLLSFLPIFKLQAQSPTIGASNFSNTTSEGNSLAISWTRGNGSAILVIASASATFNGTGVPTNGVDYVASSTFGSGDQVGAGNYVVYRGSSTGTTFSGLTASNTYYLRFYEFNGADFNTLFNTTNVLSGQGTTLSAPTAGSTNLTAIATGKSASLTWTRGNGSRSLIILSTSSPVSDPTQYTRYTASTVFGSGSSIGTGRVVYWNTTNTVNVTNLQPNTQYFYKVVESNGLNGPVYDAANSLTGSFTTESTPTVGSTSFNLTGRQGNSLTFTMTIGNGTQRLIVARQDNPVVWTPTDGVDYNTNSVFGNGDNLGNNTFAVVQTISNNVAMTGLTPNTTYHFAIFEFNGTATNTYYLTDPAKVLTGQGTTLSPPTISAGNFGFSNITGYSASVAITAGNGTARIVLVKEGSPVTDVPVNLVNYTYSGIFPSAPVIGSSRIMYDASGTSFNITSLQPNTTYHFAVFEYQGSTGPVFKQVDPGIGSFTTLGKPTVAPSNLTFTNVQGDRMTLNYQSGNGFGRIIIAKQGAPVDVFPADLTSYTADPTFGTAAAHLGNGNYVLQNNAIINNNTSTLVNGFSIGQVYHFAIIEYNGTSTQRVYMSGAEALTGIQSTLSEPTQQATNLTFSNIGSTSVTINWQNGNGNARMVLLRQSQPVQNFPVNLTNYTSSNNYSVVISVGTSRIVYDNSGSSVNVINVPPGRYHIAVVEYNGTSNPVYRTSDPLTGYVDIGNKPTVPASNVKTTNIDGNRLGFNFTIGNGLSRMTIAKEGSPVDAWPVDLTGYAANSTFGNGANLGGGNFVVASGISGSFNVQNLIPNTTYYFAVVEFNGSGATALYQDPSIVLQFSEQTLSAPTVATSDFNANNIIGNKMDLTWTRGDGDGRLIIAKAGAPVDVVPTDLTSPAANSAFGSGANLGGGNFVVFGGAADKIQLSNLEPATTYHLAFFEYNGSNGRVYLKNPGRANFTTAVRPSVAPKNLSVANINGDRFTLAFAAGNGTRRLVVIRKGGLVTALPTDLTTYTAGAYGAGTNLGNGNFVTTITNFTSSILIQGLEPDTEYGVAIFEMDGLNGNERYMTSVYINQLIKTSSPPTISTNALLFNSVGSSSVNLSWTNGNGAGRMVVLRPAQPVIFKPTVLSTHGTASTNFGSTANNLPNSHKHIYRGTATTVTITNLLPATTYHIAIFEYNGSTQPVYTYESLTGFITTLPATGLAIGGFDAITFCPLQQVDVPYVYTGVLGSGNVLSVELSDITGSFTTPLVIGTQSTVNSNGFITSLLPSSLQEGIGYRLRIRATNPASVSADNGADLQIATSVKPTFTVVGGQTSSCGVPIQITTSQPNYKLQWYRDSQLIAGATASSYLVQQTGSYQLRISGASGGCQLLSDPTTITISNKPAFNFQFDPSFCINETLNLTSLVQPAGGTFSGPGITNGVFDATQAGIGQHLLLYTYTEPVSSCLYTETTTVLVLGIPNAPTVQGGSGCELTSITLMAIGALSSETYLWYETATGGTPIVGETLDTFITPSLSSTKSYYVSILSASGGCESARTEVVATIIVSPTAPAVTAGSSCGAGTVTLNASGATNGEYRWYDVASGGTAISGEVNASYTTPSLTATTSYYVAIDNGTCESTRTEVIAFILPMPNVPTTTAGSNCGAGTIILQASGATNGEYRWYDVAFGGTALAGETNTSFTTPALTSTTTYYVAIKNGSCESARAAVIASILTPPLQPTITSNEPIVGGVVQFCKNPISLSAPAGFTYTWSGGQTTQTITIVQPGNYSVVVKDGSSCSSVSSDVIQVIINTACINSPPVINSTSLITTIGGSVSIDLTSFISDPDDNLDAASLQVVGNSTQRGGKVTLTGFKLDLDYTGINFSGNDLIIIRICDLLGVCIEKEFSVEVVGDITVYNGISPNGDGTNDAWVIQYIDLLPETQNNRVTIYNRWGDAVWEASNYDNTSVVFTGINKNGSELSSGSYFYKIVFEGGRASVTGYLSLKR